MPGREAPNAGSPVPVLDRVVRRAPPEVQLRRLAGAGFRDPAGARNSCAACGRAACCRAWTSPAGSGWIRWCPPCSRGQPAARAGAALDGMVLIIEAIGRRSAYFALLNENPVALQRLVCLCATSEFLSRLVATHPLLLDELLDPRVFERRPAGASWLRIWTCA